MVAVLCRPAASVVAALKAQKKRIDVIISCCRSINQSMNLD
jgi:hypothetical protein